MKKECKIIQDLLPNYIENVTTKETNEYIEEHLKNCEECRKVYLSMKANIELQSSEETKEVKYMKKFNKQLRILKFILLAIVIIYSLGIVRKVIIMTSLCNKLNYNYNEYMKNYHIIINEYFSKDNISRYETYHKSDTYKSITQVGSIGKTKLEMIGYKNNNEELNLVSNYTANSKERRNSPAHYQEYIPTYDINTFYRILQSFIVKIESVTIDSKECYAIKSKHWDYFIDKETGLIIKEISYATEGVDDTKYYYYEFGTVKDSDIAKPDTTGYEENSNF